MTDPNYQFFVNDQPFSSDKPRLPGLEIKALSKVDYPQQLYLEEEGSKPDRCVADRDFVDLDGNAPRRFYLVPSIINNG